MRTSQNSKSKKRKSLIKVALASLMFLTQISFAESPTPDPQELKLNPTQLNRIGKYIRDCEAEKELSQFRWEQLTLAQNQVDELESRGVDISRTDIAVTILLALASGYILGTQLQ